MSSLPASASSPATGLPWWRSAVIYQIYPRSFADSNGDGVGDLDGLRRRLDHVAALGADAIWLSPIFRSPMADAGYDVSDYCDIDPVFGSIAQAEALIAEAHARGVRVLLDFVPNHTSDQHPWFIESRSSRTNPKRDWYLWRDEPNNWRAALGAGSAWTWDDATRQHYLHLFLAAQPDFNWHNPQVIDAMHGVLRFWLDRGVDGFRIDVAHCTGKDPTWADDPRCAAGLPLSDFNDQPYSHEVLRGIRRVVDAYDGDRVIVGEVNIRSTEAVARYYGHDDELHLSFNFPPLDAPWDPQVFRRCILDVESNLDPIGAWPTWVLSNHDNRRHRTRYGGSMARARAAAVMLLTLRGTPFLYQGEELGLEDAIVTPDERVDPGGRDPCRAPMPWSAAYPHGWDGARPWLPFAPDAVSLNAATEDEDPESILALYRRVIALRRRTPSLALGDVAMLDADPLILAWSRTLGDDRCIVAINFADDARSFVPPSGRWRVELDSASSDAGQAFSGSIAATSAVVLRPIA